MARTCNPILNPPQCADGVSKCASNSSCGCGGKCKDGCCVKKGKECPGTSRCNAIHECTIPWECDRDIQCFSSPSIGHKTITKACDNKCNPFVGICEQNYTCRDILAYTYDTNDKCHYYKNTESCSERPVAVSCPSGQTCNPETGICQGTCVGTCTDNDSCGFGNPNTCGSRCEKTYSSSLCKFCTGGVQCEAGQDCDQIGGFCKGGGGGF